MYPLSLLWQAFYIKTAVSEANTLLKGERKKSFGQPAVNEVNTLLKEKFQKVGMSQQVQSLVSIR